MSCSCKEAHSVRHNEANEANHARRIDEESYDERTEHKINFAVSLEIPAERHRFGIPKEHEVEDRTLRPKEHHAEQRNEHDCRHHLPACTRKTAHEPKNHRLDAALIVGKVDDEARNRRACRRKRHAREQEPHGVSCTADIRHNKHKQRDTESTEKGRDTDEIRAKPRA